MLLSAMLLISGCGNSSDTSAAPPMSTGAETKVHTAASGPAISDKLSFDQLTLESPPKVEKDRNGLIFLRFKYADNDGKVYECVLPKAMSQGQYTLAEWSSTFAAYRLPKVVAVKKRQGDVDLADYPFISPRPAPKENVQEQQQQPAYPVSPPPPTGPSSLPQPIEAPGLAGPGPAAP